MDALFETLRGRYAEAVEYYRKAAQVDTANLEAAFGLALNLARLNKREEAQAATDRIHEEFTRRGLLGSPSMAGYFYSRSVLLMRRGELGGALAMCDSAMNYTVPLQRGQIYRQMAEVYMRARDFEPALEACEEALAISPNAPEILLTLTRVYSAKGDRRMTAEIGNRLLKLWQDADPDYENRREVLRLVGRPGQAAAASLVIP